MAAILLDTTRDDLVAGRLDACPEVEADERLSLQGAVMASVVVAAAVFLVVAPAGIAIAALLAPGELDRVYGWLLGGSAAFSIVAAGRVPAAALLILALAGRQRR